MLTNWVIQVKHNNILICDYNIKDDDDEGDNNYNYN
jgi:hypothetical protein